MMKCRWRRHKLNFRNGKNYSSHKQIIQDISINKFIFHSDDELFFEPFYENFLLTIKYYYQSRISIDDYYKTCAYVSLKTSNSQSEIDKMQFFVFNNYMIYINKILEEENKQQNGEGSDTQKSFDEYKNSTQRSFSQMSKSYKPSQMNPKFSGKIK